MLAFNIDGMEKGRKHSANEINRRGNGGMYNFSIFSELRFSCTQMEFQCQKAAIKTMLFPIFLQHEVDF